MGKYNTIPFFSSKQIIDILDQGNIDKTEIISYAYKNLYDPSNAPQKMRVCTKGPHDILLMPFWVGESFINKTMLLKKNQETPGVFGWLTFYDIETQMPMAMFDATCLTGIRTAAKSLLVAKTFLVDQTPEKIHIYGSSTQALHHYLQFSECYPSSNFLFIVRNEQSEQRIRDLIHDCKGDYEVEIAQHSTLHNPDIIITTTKSKEPFITKRLVQDAKLIIAVGSSDGQSTEISLDVVPMLKIVVDSKVSISGKGELNLALKKNLISNEQITEFHTILKNGKQILEKCAPILFVSKGLAIEDYIFAKAIMETAKKYHYC